MKPRVFADGCVTIVCNQTDIKLYFAQIEIPASIQRISVQPGVIIVKGKSQEDSEVLRRNLGTVTSITVE